MDQIAVHVHASSSDKILGLPSAIKVYRTQIRPQAAAAQTSLLYAKRDFAADHLLAQNYTPIGGGSWVFIHDSLFKSNPEWFTGLERLYFSPMLPLARFSRGIVTSSKTEAHRISNYTAQSEVVGVGLGIDRSLLSTTPVKPSFVEGLSGFLLSVGRLNARKNLNRVIEASVESGVLTSSFPLLVVGQESGSAVKLSHRAREAIETGHVRFVGHSSDAELVWLYENCSLFIFMSLGEGFGLPPVEAGYFGAPVLASDIPVMREVLNGAARLVDPTDTMAIAEQIKHMLSLDTPQIAKHYSWQDVVLRLRAVMAE